MQSKLLHRNITVVNIDASVRFYNEALGFSQVFETASNRTHCIHVRDRDGTTLALTLFDEPKGFGSTERRPFGPHGYTHLAFYIADMETTARRIEAAGGTVLHQTHARYPEVGVEMMYSTDPNGVRIELMTGPNVPAAFSHSGICVESIAGALPVFAELGFVPEESFDFSEPLDWVATITETPGLRQKVQMLRNANRDTIELLEILHPRGGVSGLAPPPNKFGFASITVALANVDAIAAALCELGCDFPEALRTVRGATVRRTGSLPWNAAVELVTLDP